MPLQNPAHKLYQHHYAPIRHKHQLGIDRIVQLSPIDQIPYFLFGKVLNHLHLSVPQWV